MVTCAQHSVPSSMVQQTDGLDEVLATLNLETNDYQSLTDALSAASLTMADVCGASTQPLDQAIKVYAVAETMPTYHASRGAPASVLRHASGMYWGSIQ